MKFGSEKTTNIQMYVNMRSMGISLAEGFVSDEVVVIHGIGTLGKMLYYDIKDKVKVLCFVDRDNSGIQYDGVEVYSIESDELRHLMMKEGITVIITPFYDIKKIKDAYGKINCNVDVKTFSQFALPLMLDKVKKERVNFPEKTINDIFLNKENAIDGINILGSQYGLLICMLYQTDYRKKLYILMGDPFDCVFDSNIGIYGLSVLHMYRRDLLNETEFVKAFLFRLQEYADKNSISTICHFFCNEGIPFVNDNFVMLEEGIGSYSSKEFYDNMHDPDMTFNAYNDSVKHVLMTGLKPIPVGFKEKVRIISIVDLWNKKSVEEKNIINEILNFPREELEECIKEGRNILVLTSPYADDHMITAKTQTDVTRQILSKYAEDKLIIKPHPRDTTKYEQLFENIRCVRGRFPIELIKLNGIKVKRIIGFGTTAIDTLRDAYEVEDFGRDIFLKNS